METDTCPLQKHLKTKFREAAFAEINSQRYQPEPVDKDRFPDRPRVRKCRKVQEKQNVIECFRKQTTFTNDPRVVHEKYFLEEELNSNKDYDFFLLISYLGPGSHLSEMESSELKLKMKRKFHLDLDKVINIAQDILKKHYYGTENGSQQCSIKEILLKHSTLTQLEVHAASLYLGKVQINQ